MKIPKKQRIRSKYWCGSKIISSGSFKLSICEVVVLMCTSNSQSMSSKLHLEVGERKIVFYFPRTQSESNVISLHLACDPPKILVTNSTEIGTWFTKMKIDINVRLSVVLSEGHEVSVVKFWSVRNVWKRSKTCTIPSPISAAKCGPAASTILSWIIF